MKRSTKAWLGVAGVLVVPGLAGCGGSSTATATTPTPQPRSVSAALPNGLTATVTEDKFTVPVGGTVTYTLTLANKTAEPITFQPVRRSAAPSVGVGDTLTVKDAGGGTAFPQGAFAQVLEWGPSETLAPGQSLSGTLTVGGSNNNLGQFSTAGRYSASATFSVLTGPGFSSQATATTGPLEVDAQ